VEEIEEVLVEEDEVEEVVDDIEEEEVLVHLLEAQEEADMVIGKGKNTKIAPPR